MAQPPYVVLGTVEAHVGNAGIEIVDLQHCWGGLLHKALDIAGGNQAAYVASTNQPADQPTNQPTVIHPSTIRNQP